VELEGVVMDNGQHILVGAYRESLRLMQQVGVVTDTALLHLPLSLELPGAMRIRAPRWPAPLHLAAALLTATGLSWREKWAATRFMAALGLRRYCLDRDSTVSDLLAAHRQPPRLCQALWEPLCVATLNTGAHEASAQLFANVLRDTLGSPRRTDSDLLLPRVDLSALFPDAAARYVEAHGGTLHRGQRVACITPTPAGWQVDEAGPYSQLILATAPQHLTPLLAPHLPNYPALGDTLSALHALQFEPIVTAYLQYPAEVSSARGKHQALTADALAAALHAELKEVKTDLPAPLWHRVITEKRATFRCTPGLPRLGTDTPLPALYLAGDHIASDYPATLESAVQSGVAAARRTLACR
jgi:predicted NAD/FAD-binding protein